jgi:alpha-N-arabinofuranosidase
METAKMIIDRDYTLSSTDENLFCSFVEPLGRCIYGGLYEPGHPSADEKGFRRDVLELIKPLNLTMNRFPGGNYTSTFRWEDSVGPKEKRPRRAEVAWQCIETNEFGLNEFAEWSKLNGSDVMMTVNLATRGVLEAMDCVEYCNLEGGTYWSDLRRSHGYNAPHGYKYWCLSNEIDGPWQVGQNTGSNYGLLAREASKAMKLVDPEIKTVLAGSSSPDMPSFPDFDVAALDAAWEQVDYLSVHNYISNLKGDTPNYLAKPLTTDLFFKRIGGLFSYIKAKKRSSHDLFISFDEFNTWHTVAGNERMEKPRWGIAPTLLEDVYNMEDAVALGSMLITVLRNCDLVKIACLSELCNCISHIRTRNGGGCWVLPPYYAFLHFSRYGRGTVLIPRISSPKYDTRDYTDVPYLDAVPVINDDGTLTVFAVNRSLTESMPLRIELRGFEGIYVPDECITMSHPDPKATNTEGNPDNVRPRTGVADVEDGILCADLDPLSWNVIRLRKQQ